MRPALAALLLLAAGLTLALADHDESGSGDYVDGDDGGGGGGGGDYDEGGRTNATDQDDYNDYGAYVVYDRARPREAVGQKSSFQVIFFAQTRANHRREQQGDVRGAEIRAARARRQHASGEAPAKLADADAAAAAVVADELEPDDIEWLSKMNERRLAAEGPTSGAEAVRPSEHDAGQGRLGQRHLRPNASAAEEPAASPRAHNVYYWRLVWFVLPLGATFGNLLVIMAVYRERSLQSVTNYFIVSLAFADLFVGLVVMPFAVYVLVNEVWELSDTICDIYVAVDVTSSTASILNLVAISIDRYRAVAYPIAYTAQSSSTIAALTICGVWLISCAVGAPVIFGLNTAPGRKSSLCILYNSTFIFWSSLASFYIPCIAMIALYWRIFSAIRSRTKKTIAGNCAAGRPPTPAAPITITGAAEAPRELAVPVSAPVTVSAAPATDERRPSGKSQRPSITSSGRGARSQSGATPADRSAEPPTCPLRSRPAPVPAPHPSSAATSGGSVPAKAQVSRLGLGACSCAPPADCRSRFISRLTGARPLPAGHLPAGSISLARALCAKHRPDATADEEEEEEEEADVEIEIAVMRTVISGPSTSPSPSSSPSPSPSSSSSPPPPSIKCHRREIGKAPADNNGLGAPLLAALRHASARHCYLAECRRPQVEAEAETTAAPTPEEAAQVAPARCPCCRLGIGHDNEATTEATTLCLLERTEAGQRATLVDLSQPDAPMASFHVRTTAVDHSAALVWLQRAPMAAHWPLLVGRAPLCQACRATCLCGTLVELELEPEPHCHCSARTDSPRARSMSLGGLDLASHTRAARPPSAVRPQCLHLSRLLREEQRTKHPNLALGLSATSAELRADVEASKLADLNSEESSSSSLGDDDDDDDDEDDDDEEEEEEEEEEAESAGSSSMSTDFRLAYSSQATHTTQPATLQPGGAACCRLRKCCPQSHRQAALVSDSCDCSQAASNSICCADSRSEDCDAANNRQPAGGMLQAATAQIKRRSLRLSQLIRGRRSSGETNRTSQLAVAPSRRLVSVDRTNSTHDEFSSGGQAPSGVLAQTKPLSSVNVTLTTSSEQKEPGARRHQAQVSTPETSLVATIEVPQQRPTAGEEQEQWQDRGGRLLLSNVISFFSSAGLSLGSAKKNTNNNNNNHQHQQQQARQQSGAKRHQRRADKAKAEQQQAQHRAGSRRRREKNAARRERKATKTLAIVLGIFLICWTPFFTCNIIDGICIQLAMDCRPGMMVYLATSWLGYINSCVNPIIYTIFNMEFRRAFKKIICIRPRCCCCC